MTGPLVGAWGPPHGKRKAAPIGGGAADLNSKPNAGSASGAQHSLGVADPQAQRGISLLEWKPMRRNTLVGFGTIRVEAIGLTISDVSVHEKNGSRWASLPSKAMVDRDGMVMRGDDGKVRYSPILQWRDRRTAERFSHALIEALLAAHPDAFDGGAS
jgi:hypothetical protein